MTNVKLMDQCTNESMHQSDLTFSKSVYSTVTDFARLRGRSTLRPRARAQ